METSEKYLAMRNLIQKTENRALVYGVTISEYLALKEIEGAGTEGITRALQPLEKLCFIETLEATDNPRHRKVSITGGGLGVFGDIEHEFLRRMNLLTFEIGKLANSLL